jgi:4-hydroxy-tetrahydrodipicolinate synthase
MNKKRVYPLNGIIITVITPFHANGSVDYESLRREIDAACEAKVAGFLVPCVASENTQLNDDERRQMTRVTVEEARGRAKVITSITDPDPAIRSQQMDEFLKMGVDGINVNLPYKGAADYFNAISALNAKNPPFLILQDLDINGPGIPDAVLIHCFNELNTVIGVKVEVHNSGSKYTRLLKETNGRMHISSGWGNDQLIELLDRGVHAVMPSGLFEIWVKIYDLYKAGDRESAKSLFYDILPVVSFTRQDGSTNRAFHKRYFKRLGIFTLDRSREQRYFDEVHAAYSDELIERALSIRANLDRY